jgi:phosphomannomutase
VTLIKSISGIRGTIGGKAGEGLTPVDVIKFTSAFGSWILSSTNNPKVVVGRDARISGSIINSLVVSTLQSLGINVVDAGLSTTPSVEMLVASLKAGGGVILTASHNPKEWNALKLLNSKGEFISGEEGAEILRMGEAQQFSFADVDALGKYEEYPTSVQDHIDAILKLPLVNVEAIKLANFRVAVDAVNSTGGVAVPMLLNALGVDNIHRLYCSPTGEFPHNPEPLPEHLSEISKLVVDVKADLGIVVDPDVDRLAIICEDGSMFGEEYTLVAISDYILAHTKGNTVSNLSSTRALSDVTLKYGGSYKASAVGEVNVVVEMKATNAVIGGEGNGGIIYPELHYGRDALVGIALFLSHLAKSKRTVSELRKTYPNYFMSKNKIELTPEIDVDQVLMAVANRFKDEKVNLLDGVKVDFANGWVHLRKSNTEPIIRIYSEAPTSNEAKGLAEKFIDVIKEVI